MQMKVTSKYFKKEFDLNKAELIGEGNFAQVYRVFDMEINDSLAIRRVDRDQGESEDIEKQKVINEELKKVKNQNILQIYDIIQTSTSVWYITEFCQGGSLWDALNTAKDNKLTEKDGLQCILQVSQGVQQLHNHRITHRDLKPQNILLKTKYIPGKPIPTIKIADFGLSTKKIIMETIAGTKQYIAPEQARFHNYTNAVDVWSLGIICDEILHGNPFYIGDNNKEVFQKIIKTPYRVRDESIRPSIKQFLISLLKKKPYERPIIAVIRQNLNKIIEEINIQKGIMEPGKKIQEVMKEEVRQCSSEKKEQKKVKIKLPQETEKSGGSSSQQPQSQSSVNDSFHDGKKKNRRFQRTENPPPTQNIRKQPIKETSKTPFKRQIPVKTQTKQEQQVHQEYENRSGRVPVRNQPHPKTANSANKQQKLPHNKLQKTQEKERQNSPTMLNPPKTAQKVTVYKVDNKKKIGGYQKKEVTSSSVELKEYMKDVMKMKEGLQKIAIDLKQRRQFLPNPHLNVNQMPQKMETEEVLKQFRQKYDYLNYFNANDDYEIKLGKGKRQMEDNVMEASKQLHEYQQKIKEAFLDQIDQYVELYVDKNIL